MTERSATGEWPAAAAELPTLPGYEVLAELGRGGMGVVYKARQINPDRLVALKLIRDGALAGAQDRARFRIEAEAVARLRHPNVISVYDVGEHQGQPYFAMEFVAGGSLDAYLAGRPQPARHAAELIRTLALAVQHAHEQKIVHRDLKPANVLLQRTEDRGQRTEEHADSLSSVHPKVSDFGLAKRLDSNSTALTQDGAVLGTPSYMAPEQAAGRVGEIGPATDVYALGAILYEMLTGRPPFQAESWNRTVDQVLNDEPAPPTRWQADVPRDLETICLKCLEKEPGRRYTNAQALADDLGRFLADQSVAAVALSAAERLTRLAARDGYQLCERIGRGPRSTVYRAVFGPLKQPVAVKVFPPGLCTRDEWEARLRRGAEQWSLLAHPQVVLAHRTGWWDDSPYLETEYVPHGSLAARLTGRPSPVREAVHLVEQLTEIVCYLHRQGVVHGNLKPGNVLLAADGIPRVIDLRSTGGLSGGPPPDDDSDPAGLGYLAPELVREPDAEPRLYTDIYGLGVILYELLTGRPPFAGATAREVLNELSSREPEPPTTRNPLVTPQLEAICMRCLRKNPWRRFRRAYDLVPLLRNIADHPDGRTVPGQSQTRRPPPGRQDRPRSTM